MGEVYRARDTRLGRDVAVKVLPEAFAADFERMGRFEREAKVLASLNHPNIATIHGFEESGHVRGLVMELVEGATLAERIAKGPISLEEALPIARQIAEGLEYAHERGIVHRDLKPANVKITPDGAVKLLDFGLAKALEGEATRGDPSSSPTISRMATQAGIILGTAAYMSPEQAKGRRVDRRADIWAFGCVLYEALTGKRAFDGETVTDILAAVVRGEPDWSLLRAGTPPSIRKLLARCLTKDARQRLRDIGEARIAIEEALRGESDAGAGLQPAPAEPAGSSGSRLGRALPWALSGALAIVAGVLAFGHIARAPRAAMHFSAVTNFSGMQTQPSISPDGRSVAFVSNRDGDFNVYVGLARGGSLVQITHDPNLESAPRWSPDGATLAYARLNHWGMWDVWEVPALGGTPRRVVLNAADPDWSPDGHSLAYLSMTDRGIWISGTSGENAHQAVPAFRRNTESHGVDTQPRFSPDGREIAFAVRGADGGPGGDLAVVDLASGKTRLIPLGKEMNISPAWSADGRFLYFASSRGGTINIWKVAATGGEAEQITAGEGDDADLDVSKDGKQIVFGTVREKIGINQLDLGAKPGQPKVKVLTTDPARNQLSPTYSPDGKHLAYFTNLKGLKGVENEAIWYSDADGANAAVLAQDARVNIFPAWTPDSESLVYSSIWNPDAVQIRRVALSGGAPQTLGTVTAWSMYDVGQDGRVLFLGGKNQAKALDPRTGKTQTLGTLPGAEPWFPVLWSADEHSVAYMVRPRKDDDPRAGLWVDDFQGAPRQLFRGWVIWFAHGPGNELYLLEGKPDLHGVLWKVSWDGKGLQRTAWTVPLLCNDNYDHTQIFTDFGVSPDGHHLAFETNQVLEENIGMIENVR
jgi:Tol biopolymer transport system component